MNSEEQEGNRVMRQFHLGLVLLGVSFLSWGCQQGDERLREKADIESQVTAANSVKADFEFQSKRAAEIELDLEQRHRFYEALRGTYEGLMTSLEPLEGAGLIEGGVQNAETYFFRIKFFPSFPPYQVKRVRTLAELEYEINNLFFTVQVQQWAENAPLSAVGCRVDGVRPDMRRGRIRIASKDCPNTYEFSLEQLKPNPEFLTFPGLETGAGADVNSIQKLGLLKNDLLETNPAELSEQVRAGLTEDILALRGIVQPTTNAKVYRVESVRIKSGVEGD